MEKFLEELEMLDSKENQLATLDHLLEVYLTSKEANHQEERIDTMVLVGKLRELFL
ncbi:hypothetical protein J0871_17030 [Salegentibacter sp. BDJ18]|uniref:hypothetical protein n=1 Tax=Salegentibacter sp. BDJ18 TaxID=2816376 RepID=UPI001AAE8494|nr:hypothetical protein [Salegentibacter sp. BDJ18]MBO2546123.1 hypothetical protein [Salegentibacter sp. BDJ18]